MRSKSIRFYLICFLFAMPGSVFAQNLFVRVRVQKNLDTMPTELIQNSKIRNTVQQKENGKFDVIATVPLTDYLAGVVSKEMPLSWPKEALKAQAVVARSYVLARMSERKNKTFHVESDQMDQVFKLTNSIKAYQAVTETQNIFLMDQNKKILKAFYHADCGGQTVPANLVWAGATDSGVATDIWCEIKDNNKWSFSVSKVDFYFEGGSHIKKYKNKIIEIAGFSIQKLRENFGFDLIRNAPTQIQQTEDSILISGQGYGHGAGLCQHGTLAQVKLGLGYLDIIKHYYPKAIISDQANRLANFNLVNYLIFKM